MGSTSRQASGESVMFWTMFCWETSLHVIHVDVTLTPTSVLLKTTNAINKNDTPADSGLDRRGWDTSVGFTSQPTGLKGSAGDRDNSTHDGSTGVLFLEAKVGISDRWSSCYV